MKTSTVRVWVFGLASLVAVGLSGKSAAAEAGRIFVKSRPSGAQVFLDEETKPRGKAPCIVRNVPPGTHVLRGRLEGYVDVTHEVEVTAGGLVRASLTFVVKKGDVPGGGEDVTVIVKTGPDADEDEDATDATKDTGGASSEPDEDKPAKYIHVDCPVCRGTGLLQEMGCPSCKGTGWAGIRRCAACGGTRRVKFGCPYCKGVGIVVRGRREADCPKCKGKGKLPCPLCRGTGKLKRNNPELSGKPTIACPYCQGSGFENDVKCIRCTGRGKYVPHGGGWVIVSHIECPFCGGDGKGPPVCPRCRGAGCLSPEKNPTICPACFGTGQQFRPCRYCRGKGWIKTK